VGVESTPLRLLAPGAAGIIAPPDDQGVCRRLLELGLVPGTHVTIIRHAPAGGPIELELRGYRLCLRRSDLAGLRVISTRPAP